MMSYENDFLREEFKKNIDLQIFFFTMTYRSENLFASPNFWHPSPLSRISTKASVISKKDPFTPPL